MSPADRKALKDRRENDKKSLQAALKSARAQIWALAKDMVETFDKKRTAEYYYRLIMQNSSLHDKPHVIQDLVFQCVRPRAETLDEEELSAVSETAPSHPQYLLFLTPREPFLWTGRVMTLPLPWIDVDMKEQRLRLVANGVGPHLEQCKQHLAWQFSMYGPGATSDDSHEQASTLPLDR